MRRFLGLVLAGALGVGSPAAGGTVDASVTSVVNARPEPVEGEGLLSVPVLALLQLSAREFEFGPADDIRVQLVGFVGWDPLRTLRDSPIADVQLAFVEGRLLDKRFHVRAGRQLVFLGGSPRAVHLDGAWMDARIAHGFGMRAYLGAPVAPEFGPRRADAELGLRAYYSPAFRTELGASYQLAWDEGRSARNQVGLDGRWAPSTEWNVTGQVVFSLDETRLVEAQVGPRWRPMRNLDLWMALRRTAPDLWLPRTSILSVFAEEERDEVGIGAFYAPLPRLDVSADYRLLRVLGAAGHDAGLRASYDLRGGRDTLLIGELRLLKQSVNGYQRARLGVIHRGGRKLTLSAEGDVYFLDEPINGYARSFTANGTVGWALAPSWNLALTGIASLTPMYRGRFDVLARVTYALSAGGRSAATERR